MKLLVSDYDLTFNVLDYDVFFNVRAIERFRKQGHLFFLNTGRNYESIKKEIDKYHINYDYLGCCDGNLVLNRHNKIVSVSNLSPMIYNEIDKLHQEFSFKLECISYHGNVLEYAIETLENEEFENRLRECASRNNLSFAKFSGPRIINGKIKKMYVYFLYDKSFNKSSATDYVGKLENISKCDIFTIGDNHNDLEMIRDFNGYTLPWGKKTVKEVSSGKVLSVKGLVKKITR